jgi:hypothetical protein
MLSAAMHGESIVRNNADQGYTTMKDMKSMKGMPYEIQ